MSDEDIGLRQQIIELEKEAVKFEKEAVKKDKIIENLQQELADIHFRQRNDEAK